MKYIGYNAFWNHDKLKEIHLDPNNQSFVLVDGVLFNKEKNYLYLYPSNRPQQKTYDIPEGVTRIESSAFSDATFLRSISLPDSLISIEDFAFWGCTHLMEIKIQKGLKRIASSCFGYLPYNAKIYIPATVTYIHNDAFYGCENHITIEGENGSYAEEYASRKGIKFIGAEKSSDGASDDRHSEEDNTSMMNVISSDVSVGDIVKFGHYEQDNNLENGPEEIEWIVLDYDATNNKALLLSKYGLDVKPYNTKLVSVTWENCTLREWLNGVFLNMAFNPEEQSAILMAEVDNSASQRFRVWNTDGGNNTLDQIFLLSYAEANRYLDITYDLPDNLKSRVAPTAYAVAHGAFVDNVFKTEDKENTGRWWLRSPGFLQNGAAYVNNDGTFYSINVVNSTKVARPAFWLNLGSDIFKSRNQ